MALKPRKIPEIPPETVRAARAVFPKGNIYIFLRDRLGTIYQDDLFADLYPHRGRPTYSPWRLARVTVFQFMENLTDRQAADAVRSRLDWKYAATVSKYLTQALTTLCSPSSGHGWSRLPAEERLLEAVLALCKQQGWLKGQGQQRTDSTPVLARIRALSRAECVVETLRHALNILSVVTPDWLQNQVQPDWLERYGPRESRVSVSRRRRQTSTVPPAGRPGWVGTALSHHHRP